MDSEISRNQKCDNHYANDGKDVHFALLPLHEDGVRCISTPCMRRYQVDSITPSSMVKLDRSEANTGRCYLLRLYPQ